MSLLDLDLRGIQVNLPLSDSDDSSEAESESSSVEISFMTTRELCVCGCGKWAWLKWHGDWLQRFGTAVTHYNGMCFQDEELQIYAGWLNARTRAISRTGGVIHVLWRVVRFPRVHLVRQDVGPERLGMPALLDRGILQARDDSLLVLQSITSTVAR